MTLGQQEQRLEDVLAVIEAARVPHAHARRMAETLRGLVDHQSGLERLLAEMGRDLGEVIGTLGALGPEDERQRAAHARMLEHLRRDLAQVEATRRAVERATGAMYAGFYTLL